jgi:PIN domain nuclease of toxin-antitoxin system
VILLLDTHILLWMADDADRLPAAARKLVGDRGNDLFFSAISICEIAIKSALGRVDFQVDARLFRRGLLAEGYTELPVTGEHGAAVASLPLLHKDPFDRILIAQAIVEGLPLVTSDPVIARYPCPIRVV